MGFMCRLRVALVSCILTLSAVHLHRLLGFTFCQRLIYLNSSQQQRPVRGRSHNLVSLYEATCRRSAAGWLLLAAGQLHGPPENRFAGGPCS